MSYLLASPATEQLYDLIIPLILLAACLSVGLPLLYCLILLYRWILGTDKIINHLDAMTKQSAKIDQKLKTLQETENDSKTLLNAIEKNTTPPTTPPDQSDPPDPSNNQRI